MVSCWLNSLPAERALANFRPLRLHKGVRILRFEANMCWPDEVAACAALGLAAAQERFLDRAHVALVATALQVPSR